MQRFCLVDIKDEYDPLIEEMNQTKTLGYTDEPDSKLGTGYQFIKKEKNETFEDFFKRIHEEIPDITTDKLKEAASYHIPEALVEFFDWFKEKCPWASLQRSVPGTKEQMTLNTRADAEAYAKLLTLPYQMTD